MRHALLSISLMLCIGANVYSADTPVKENKRADKVEPVAKASSPAQSLAEQGAGFVKLLAEGKFNEAEKLFDSAMKKGLKPGKLKQIWAHWLSQLGAFGKQVSVQLGKHQQYGIVIVTCKFKKAVINVRVVFDPKQRVAGLFFQPVSLEPYKAPSYVDRKKFEELELTVGAKPWQLPATLSIPVGHGPFSAVILVHGSGPNDRDETIGPNKVFRDLAWGLASRGVAVLRYEKRTKAHQQAMGRIITKLTIKEEVIDDALAAVRLLRSQKKFDGKEIILLGHSLGGMLAPRIGKLDPKLAGLIILAGPTRPLEDLIVEQVTYIVSLDGKITDAEKQELDQIKKQVAQVKAADLSPETANSDLPLGMPANYWLALAKVNPVKTAQVLTMPMLIMQGGRDYQVTTKDFAGWKQGLDGRKNISFKLYPALNHLFIAGKGVSTPAEYLQVGHVSIKVVEDIAGWVLRERP